MKKMIRLDKYNNIKEDTEGIYTLESIESDNEYRNSEESSDYISSENDLSDQEIEEISSIFKNVDNEDLVEDDFNQEDFNQEDFNQEDFNQEDFNQEDYDQDDETFTEEVSGKKIKKLKKISEDILTENLSDIEDDEIDIIDDDIESNNVSIEIQKEKRITRPYFTKYEIVRILATRTKQLSLGAKRMLNIVGADLTPFEVAKKELEYKVIPFIIKRNLPDGNYELFKCEELELLEQY